MPVYEEKDFKKKQKELTDLNWDGEEEELDWRKNTIWEDPLSKIIKSPGTGFDTAEAEDKGTK